MLNLALLEVTRQAVNRRLPFIVAIHAKAHRVLDVSLGDGLFGDVPMTGRAFDLRSDMRRVIELDVIFVGEPVDALPRQVDALVSHGRHLLDAGPIGCDGVVADHAGPEARNTRDRSLVHPFVAELAHHALADVRVMRELDRLLRVGPPIQKVIDRRAKCRTCRCKHAGGLAGKRR